jgi:hypothetical protein
MSRTVGYRRISGIALVVLTCLVSAACSSGGNNVFNPGGSGSSGATASHALPTLVASLAAPSSTASMPASPPPSSAAADVLSALRTMLSADDASYRIHVSARISVGMVFNYEIDMAVSGDDISATVDMSSGTQETTVAVVAADGRGYARIGESGDWTEIDMSSVDSMASEWLDLTDPDYFEFDRVEGSGAATLYVFRNSKPIPQTPESNSIITWGKVTITDCELKVRPDGTPVSMVAKETGKATMSGSPVNVDGTMTYTFTDVGKPIEIQAPV